MPTGRVRQSDSILIVSSSEQLTAIVKRSLHGFITVDVAKSISQARRCILERSYDLVVVNVPLPDETGEYFALDVTGSSTASVMLVVPQEICADALEAVTDQGVFVLPRPFPTGRMDQALRFLMAIRSRMNVLEARALSAEEKLEEMRLVNKAKVLLVQERHMTEDEAHRYIGKMAMDNGVTRKSIALRILEE